MKNNYSYIRFGDFAEIQPSIKISRGTKCGFIPMEAVNPSCKYVYPAEEKKYDGSGVKFENDDIVFARITPCLEHGKIAVVKGLRENKGFGSSEYYVFREREGVSNRDYIYYLAISPLVKGNAIVSMVGASGRQRAQKDVIENTTVKVPDLLTQKRVSLILSTYDDLIDSNRRRIQLLEESARLLFREWFAYFKFPGHEKVKIVDGVPEGWRKGLLKDIAVVRKGRNITFEQAIEGDIPVVGGGLEPTYYHNKANVSAPVITISASGANAGYVNLYDTDIWASDCSYIDEISTKHLYGIYLRLKSLQSTIFGLQVGAAQPHVYPKDLNRLSLLIAPDELCAQFEQLVTPIFYLIKNLKFENQKLAQARDLLLPRLMSGAIEV